METALRSTFRRWLAWVIGVALAAVGGVVDLRAPTKVTFEPSGPPLPLPSGGEFSAVTALSFGRAPHGDERLLRHLVWAAKRERRRSTWRTVDGANLIAAWAGDRCKPAQWY